MKTLRNALFIIMTATICSAAGWRTDGKGYYPNATPPTNWSAEENVVWKTKMPSWSNASPTIEGDRIFVCAEPSTILCISKTDGSILWQAEHPYESFLSPEDQKKAKELAPKIKELEARMKKLRGEERSLKKIKDEAERKEKSSSIKKEMNQVKADLNEAKKYSPPSTHGKNGYSSPTPVCDGSSVFVLFGNGVAACHKIDGTKQWARLLGKPKHNWGHSSSPVIVGPKVIVQINDVIALDINTGKELWRVPAKLVFGSVVSTKLGDKDLAVTAEGKVIDIETGNLIAEDLHRLTYCAPVVIDGIAYLIEHGGGAFKLSSEKGAAKQLWKTEPKKDRYYGSPAIHEGLIYAVTQKGVLSVIDANDGKVINEQTLGTSGTHYTSPTLAGAYLFIGSEGGEMAVLKSGKEPEKIAVNKLEGFRTNPVFEGSRIYLRTFDYLYCIGK